MLYFDNLIVLAYIRFGCPDAMRGFYLCNNNLRRIRASRFVFQGIDGTTVTPERRPAAMKTSFTSPFFKTR